VFNLKINLLLKVSGMNAFSKGKLQYNPLSLLFYIVISSFIYSPYVFAVPKIHEVQPYPITAPIQLAIWGTGFNDPEIFFGTYSTPLTISIDQSLCANMADFPAPPLEPANFECIAVDLPMVAFGGNPIVPSGDYLLKIVADGGDDICTEKPSSLTFLYTPADCSGMNSQTKDSCFGDMTGAVGPTTISTFGKDADKWAYPVGINPDDEVTFSSLGSRWGNQLNINFEEGGFSQTIGLHTSCSEPLVIGQFFGSFQLVDYIGGQPVNISEFDLYDLTLGSVGPTGPSGDQGAQGKLGDTGVQGDQGVQGKLGDAGAQGVQGKLGDTGAQGVQGVQGKLGDTGAQGVQGKLGDTGAQGVQGVQGKLGDTGAQGVQGKLGDTGAQGVQGKLGDTGAQGVQGKLGDTGAQGVQGKLGDTGAQGVQGKLGDTGAQGVQGKLGDTGAQGVQGKLGDTGAQGVQGKLGDTGAQGVQGKLGDTGAQGDQGVQGKLGDTGAQGVQGKLGDTGAQGVQGKLGDTGPQGIQGAQGIQGVQGKIGDSGADGVGTQGEPGADAVDGVGSNLMCFSTDQTIGTSGKYMGLGTQAGNHDSVGVISPFGADAEVITLVVKAAIGNTARSGIAQLYHDAAGGAQGGEALGGICTLDLSTVKSTCQVTLAIGAGELDLLDSLSVFIKADSGSFEGGSACVLIDPDGS
jgi:hypothetical protein